MKRRVTIEFENCYECPFHECINCTTRKCKKENKIIFSHAIFGFPKWCPLEMVLECGD